MTKRCRFGDNDLVLKAVVCKAVILLLSSEFLQAIVSEVEKHKNVLQATNQPNLYERLEDIQTKLAVCEKALAEYLETKRLAFPRFYFVSSADLLDILSNGNDPSKVSVIATKL